MLSQLAVLEHPPAHTCFIMNPSIIINFSMNTILLMHYDYPGEQLTRTPYPPPYPSSARDTAPTTAERAPLIEVWTQSVATDPQGPPYPDRARNVGRSASASVDRTCRVVVVGA